MISLCNAINPVFLKISIYNLYIFYMKSFGFSKFTLLDSIVSYKSTNNDPNINIVNEKKPKTL